MKSELLLSFSSQFYKVYIGNQEAGKFVLVNKER